MKVIQVNQTPTKMSKAEQLRLEKSFHKCLRLLQKMRVRNRDLLFQKKEITWVFLTQLEMKKINFQFRKKNKPTDILSFSSPDKNSIGELLLCLDILEKQGKELGHGREKETLYMLIHGLLHLLGYDHELSQNEELLMFRIQDKCFQQLV